MEYRLLAAAEAAESDQPGAQQGCRHRFRNSVGRGLEERATTFIGDLNDPDRDRVVPRAEREDPRENERSPRHSAGSLQKESIAGTEVGPSKTP